MKNLLRNQWKNKRRSISICRKIEAKKHAYSSLLVLLDRFKNILSFAPFSTEIDLWPINHYLAEKQKLYLPKTTNNYDLNIYHIQKIESELSLSKLNILEPNNLSKIVSTQEIDCVLVPGLAFDCNYTRLGYGKGCYDRLIPQLKSPAIGIGYKEQLSKTLLPREKHDQPLDLIYLF